MLVSQVSSQESKRIKKRFYIGEQDEYNCSSEPLNGLVFSTILDSMPSYASSRRKALKQGYIADLVREGGISPCSLLLGMLYIRRLALTNQEYLATVSSRDLFLVAMVVASKFMNDEGELEALTNSEWSTVGSTPKATVDQLERDFLKAIDWRLYVPIGEFYSFVGSVEGRVAMEQACRRGWMTYTDLAAVWDNTDLQVSMLKHAAKVAFSGVSLYLVCVSTLLAALQPLALFSTDSSPAHQLQQESLQAPASIQVGQLVPTSQLVPAGVGSPPPPWQEVWPANLKAETPPPPWQEVWPANRSLLEAETPPPPWQEVWPANRSRSLLEASISPHMLLTTFDESAFHPWQHTPPGPTPWRARPATDPIPWRAHHPANGPTPWRAHPPATGVTRDALIVSEQMAGPEYLDPQDNSSQEIPSSSVATHPLFCVCRGKKRESLAKVEMPPAQDLSYQHKGTFHWDLINSSFSDNKTSVSGALSIIVRYLTPHWIA